MPECTENAFGGRALPSPAMEMPALHTLPNWLQGMGPREREIKDMKIQNCFSAC